MTTSVSASISPAACEWLTQNKVLYMLDHLIEGMVTEMPQNPLQYMTIELLKQLGKNYYPSIIHPVGLAVLSALHLASDMTSGSEPLPLEVSSLMADRLAHIGSTGRIRTTARTQGQKAQAELVRASMKTPSPHPPRIASPGCHYCAQQLANVPSRLDPAQWWAEHNPPGCKIGIVQMKFYHNISYEKVPLNDAKAAVTDALSLLEAKVVSEQPQMSNKVEHWRCGLLENAVKNLGINKPAVRDIIRNIVPSLSNVEESQLSIEVVSGGITNLLFKVSHISQQPKNPPLLVRVFGAEGMIDRDLENATFQALSEVGISPTYYGRFRNGRVEGWYEGYRPLDLHEMPLVAESLAKEMALLHKFVVPEALKPYYIKPGMWEQLWAWFKLAKQNTEIPGKFTDTDQIRFQNLREQYLGEGFSKAEEEVREMEAALSNHPAPDCFCHNDLLAGNIMINEKTRAIKLIDFEYGGCNYRGFDIANHWNEWAGGTQIEMNGKAEYHRFPNDQQQMEFCSSYLSVMVPNGKPTEQQITALVQEARRFVLINHWYWGLWAINQAVEEGTSGFDYITYADTRLKQYYSIKQAFL